MSASEQQVRAEKAEVAESVAEAWQRIAGWLAEHAPASLAALAGPASAEEIAAAESALGLALPAEFAASLAIHRAVDLNGAADIEHGDLAELAGLRDFEVEDCFWSIDEVHEQVRLDDSWRRGWIPLGREGDGSLFVLDLDPAPAGSYGQVLYADQGNVPDQVYHPGWLGALRSFADELEAGRYHGVDGLIEYRP